MGIIIDNHYTTILTLCMPWFSPVPPPLDIVRASEKVVPSWLMNNRNNFPPEYAAIWPAKHLDTRRGTFDTWQSIGHHRLDLRVD